jgi:hypothetical protein
MKFDEKDIYLSLYFLYLCHYYLKKSKLMRKKLTEDSNDENKYYLLKVRRKMNHY